MVNHLAEDGIRASTWNRRAWTFQERLLSKRCLIFTEGRVFFQCRSTTMSEDIVAEPGGAGWSLDLVQAPPQMLLELNRRAFWVYMNCVSLYSDRLLSKPKDILAAFNGVSNMIRMPMEASFIFGLPSSHFDLALLWEPIEALDRREPQKEDEKEAYEGNEFPSWSWCGWMGAKMEYRNSMIEGCLANVHEWLRDRTWISWFIRDGGGNLRPLWDGDNSRRVGVAEERWRGYGSYRRTSDQIEYHQRRAYEQGGGQGRDGIFVENEQIEIIQKDGELYDDYGRKLPNEIAVRPRKKFRTTLPRKPISRR